MAAVVRSAPVPEVTGINLSSLVDTTFYNNVDNSLSIIKKIALGIPETHRACITAETMDLNSEKGKFAVVEENIGIPANPILHVLSEDITLSLEETTLVQMLKGILLHQTVLSSVSPHLGQQDTVTELLADTRDLLIQIRKMLKTIQGDTAEQPAAPVLDLRLPGEFEVQVTTHVTLQRLRDFGQDMERILRRVAQANEDMTESTEHEQL